MSPRTADRRHGEGPVSIKVLSSERILEVHRALVEFFAMSSTPIRDLGLRDQALLEQAVSLQFEGVAGGSDPREKAAALLQGLFDELPFHDGNAQTAFVALMLHLDDNGFAPNRVSFDDFHQFFEALAEHRMEHVAIGKTKSPGRKRSAEADESEFARLKRWVESRTRWEERRDHPLALSELQRLLAARGYGAVEVQVGTERALEIARVEANQKKRFFGLTGPRKISPEVLARIPAPGPEGMVSMASLREIRKACGLESCDFYDSRARIDSFIRQYQTLLTRLGRL